MIFPIFEYLLLIYLVFDFLATFFANKRGELECWFWIFSKIVFPINFLLCAQFRQVFVNYSYLDISTHTSFFLGLQLALMLTAIQNVLFIYDTNTAYKIFGSTHKERLQNTRTWALIYLIGDIMIGIPKFMVGLSVVMTEKAAPWTLKEVFGMKVGKLIDLVWMFFNAIIPVIISYYRSKNEQPINFVISQDAAPSFVLDEKEEDEKTILVSVVPA